MALITDVPQLGARHSLWGELLCQGDRVADGVGDSLLGGEMGQMAPSIWEILCKLCLLGTRHPGAGHRCWHRIAEPSSQKRRGAGGAGDAEGAVPVGDAEGARAAGKGCCCPDSRHRFSEPERETGAMASGHLCSWPKRIPRLQGSGSVLTLGVEGFGLEKRLQQVGHQWDSGAVQWEPQCWLLRGPLGLLPAEDGGCWLWPFVWGSPRRCSQCSTLPRPGSPVPHGKGKG